MGTAPSLIKARAVWRVSLAGGARTVEYLQEIPANPPKIPSSAAPPGDPRPRRAARGSRSETVAPSILAPPWSAPSAVMPPALVCSAAAKGRWAGGQVAQIAQLRRARRVHDARGGSYAYGVPAASTHRRHSKCVKCRNECVR